MSNLVNATPAAERWNKYDNETALKSGSNGENVVAHGASATANFKAVGKDLLDTIDPTNHFRDTWHGLRHAPLAMALPYALVMAPWNLIREVADVVVKPAQAVKDLTDVVAHAVVAAIEVARK